MDYGNTKITSMHMYPRRRNVATQVAEELQTVTYARRGPTEERRKEEEEIIGSWVDLSAEWIKNWGARDRGLESTLVQ